MFHVEVLWNLWQQFLAALHDDVFTCHAADRGLLWLDIDDLLEDLVCLVTSELDISDCVEAEYLWRIVLWQVLDGVEELVDVDAVENWVLADFLWISTTDIEVLLGTWNVIEDTFVVEVVLTNGVDESAVEFICDTSTVVDFADAVADCLPEGLLEDVRVGVRVRGDSLCVDNLS